MVAADDERVAVLVPQATVVPAPSGGAAAIDRAHRPITQTDVEASLRAAGVTSGSTVIQ